MLMKNNSSEIQREISRLTPRKILQTASSINSLQRVAPHGAVKIALDLAITKFSLSLNNKYNLTDLQVKEMVNHIVEYYKYETIEDIVYVLEQAKRGVYGIVYGFDISVFSEWMSKHLETKAAEREALATASQAPKHPKQNLQKIAAKAPDWFKEMSPEKQEAYIARWKEKQRKQYYEKGVEFLKRQSEREKQRKNPFKDAKYIQVREQFIKEYNDKQNDQKESSNKSDKRGGTDKTSSAD